MNLYTTNLEVSKRIKELVGEQKTVYYWYEYVNRAKWDDSDPFHIDYVGEEEAIDNPEEYNGRVIVAPAYTLCQLPEVLKKVGEKLGWTVERQHLEWIMVCGYLFHGDNVGLDNYLMELLK